MIKWIKNYENNVKNSLFEGMYYSIINIIPYIIDDIIYNKISKGASVFIYPLLVAFTEYAFEFMTRANQNVFANALRSNIQIIQICSLFGCFFLSFIIALFASVVDYSYIVYKNEKKISKFVYSYAIIIILIYIFYLKI
jgi:apolipoprotein N-acyltransferase